MKTLYLIRHAKSSWAFNLPDHDRPLGKRGRKDAIKMGRYLADNHIKPEALVSSTASRAFYTALHICDQLGVNEDNIRLSKGLYHAGVDATLKIIRSARSASSLALFGHNPGFTSCANALALTQFDNVPTCGVVGIQFAIDHWDQVRMGEGKLLFHYFPKKIFS